MSDRAAKRVLFVAYYFPPRGGAGVQRSLKFVKHLRRFGWEPTVLTDDYKPRGRAYDDSLLAEVPDGTEIVRVASPERLFIALSRWGLGRLAGVFMRPDTQAPWAMRAGEAARRLHDRQPFDAVYTSVQPWSAGLVGLNLKRHTGVPWVSDFRDPWTRSLHLTWPTRLHWRSDRRLEGFFLDAADATLVVTPTMRDEFIADHPGVPPDKIKVIYNGYDEDDFLGHAAPDSAKFTVVFTGKFQYDYRADAAPSLMARLRRIGTYGRRDALVETHSPVFFLRGLADFLRRFPDRRATTHVVFAGSVGDGNRSLVNELSLGDVVETAGYLPHALSVALLKSADALLLPMFSTADPAERVAYASGKIFEYMAARRPILALTQEGDAKDLAEKSGLGLVAPPADAGAISRAIETLYDDWAAGGGRFAPNDDFICGFTREKLAMQLAETLDLAVRNAGAKR